MNADRADRFGGDIRVNFKDLSLGGGYIRQQADVTETTPPETTPPDEAKKFSLLAKRTLLEESTTTNTTKNLWFVEGHYFVFPWLIPYARYESLTVDTADQDQARIIGGIAFLLRANIKLSMEYRYYLTNQPREAAGQGRSADDLLSFQLDYSF